MTQRGRIAACVVALASVCLPTLGAPPASGAAISRGRAARIAARALGGGAILGLPRAVRAGSVIADAGPDVGARATYRNRVLSWRVRVHRTRERTWLFWRNLEPAAEFPHPSRLVLISAATGRVVVRQRLAWWPLVNLRPPPFATVPQAARDPGRGAADRATAASINIENKVVPVLPSSLSSTTSLTPGLNLHGDCMVAMINDSDSGFRTDRELWPNLAARLGIPYRTADNPTSLDTEVGALQGGGCNDLVLVLSGHGLPAGLTLNHGGVEVPSLQPLVLLGEKNFQLVPIHGAGYLVAKTSQVVDEQGMLNVMRRHPSVRFKLLVDACYSGRWQSLRNQDPDPNQIAVIATSANATDSSPNPIAIRDASGQLLLPPSPFAFLLSDGIANWAVGGDSVGLDAGDLAKGIARAFAGILGDRDVSGAGATVSTSVSAQLVNPPPPPPPPPPPAASCAAIDAYAGHCDAPAGQIAVRVSIFFAGDGEGSVAITPAGVTASSTAPPPSYGNPAYHDVFFYATPRSDVTLTATPAAGSTWGGWARTSNGAGCPQTGSGSPRTCKITVGSGPNVIPGHGFTITVAPYFSKSP